MAVLTGRENELLDSESAAFGYISDAEKEKFAKQLLSGLGKTISPAKPVKRKKPLKLRLKEWFRWKFGIDQKVVQEKIDEIEKDLANYKIYEDD